MLVKYFIKYQGNYKGATDWTGVLSHTIKETEMEGTLDEVKIKAINELPILLPEDGVWHQKSEDVLWFGTPESKDKTGIGIGNYVQIYPTCTLKETVEGRKHRKRNESVSIGFCEPCRQLYLEHIGVGYES